MFAYRCYKLGMETFTRQFDAARQAQGFRSQEHLDAFFAAFDHARDCASCKALDGHVLLDDGYQPTEGRCSDARRLDAATAEASR